MLTDSGGFQVMSLSELRKVSEKRSPSALISMAPRSNCRPSARSKCSGCSDPTSQCKWTSACGCRRSRAISNGRCSCRCAGRSEAGEPSRARRRATCCSASSRAAISLSCAAPARAALVAIGFHGYAIGGLAVGEPQSVMLAMVEEVEPILPQDRPRYLMGVGTPEDILEAVARGDRHVRLRHADAQRPSRDGLHPVRSDQSAQCPPRRRSTAARPGKPVAIGQRLLTRLSAPSCEVGRDAGSDVIVGNQRRVLPAPDAGHQASDFAGILRAFANIPAPTGRKGDTRRIKLDAPLRQLRDQLQAKRVSECLVTKP